MDEGGDVRVHFNGFFDAVDKLGEMDVEINPDLLAIMLLYSPNSKIFKGKNNRRKRRARELYAVCSRKRYVLVEKIMVQAEQTELETV
jgi:hypothetical protein